jgi:hypothetical protein
MARPAGIASSARAEGEQSAGTADALGFALAGSTDPLVEASLPYSTGDPLMACARWVRAERHPQVASASPNATKSGPLFCESPVVQTAT